VVEILSQCPTYFGRKNRLGEAAEMLVQYRTTTARLGSRRLAEQPGLIARGVFVETRRPEYCESYDQVMARAMGEAER
jgi:2-oxoglutarate ferredoxin oxidoreductase subunit beta